MKTVIHEKNRKTRYLTRLSTGEIDFCKGAKSMTKVEIVNRYKRPCSVARNCLYKLEKNQKNVKPTDLIKPDTPLIQFAKKVDKKRKFTSLLQYYPHLTRAFKYDRDHQNDTDLKRVLLDPSCKDAEIALKREGFLPEEYVLHKKFDDEKVLKILRNYRPKGDDENDFKVASEDSSEEDEDEEDEEEDEDDDEENEDDDDDDDEEEKEETKEEQKEDEEEKKDQVEELDE